MPSPVTTRQHGGMGSKRVKRAAELDEDDGEHLLEDLATIPS